MSETCPRCGEPYVAMEEDIHELHYWCPRNHHWTVETGEAADG